MNKVGKQLSVGSQPYASPLIANQRVDFINQIVGNVSMLVLFDGVTAEPVIASYPENAAFIDGYGVEYRISFTSEYGFQFIFP